LSLAAQNAIQFGEMSGQRHRDHNVRALPSVNHRVTFRVFYDGGSRKLREDELAKTWP
jgi:hypothetical protein